MALIAQASDAPASVIRLHERDDVVIARQPLPAGTEVSPGVVLSTAVPAAHKIALRPIGVGETIRRYGQIIGVATADIAAGDHVHVHNLSIGQLEDGGEGAAKDYAIGSEVVPVTPVAEPATFMGIPRPDGRVATRNYIGILTSVNCSATVAHAIADHFRRDVHPQAMAPYPNVDGVVALTHGVGCAVAADGEALAMLQRTLAGYARHVNFAAVLVIGLGCETNQIEALIESQGLQPGPRLYPYTIQQIGGTTRAIAEGIRHIEGLLAEANRVERVPCSAEHLRVALQCGGSDGYSGITANPALGAAVDRLVAHGGSAVLAETPEIYGAEHLLTRRAVSPAVADKLIARIHWWEAYCRVRGASLDNNPSAGNKAGGLTTILEKSLGAVAKAGTVPLVEVLEYAEPMRERGLAFMDSPGFDPVSVTGQVASGCNLIAFTTGRGSAFGCAPVPSLKLATNSTLWQRQRDDMDINCGTLVDGETDLDTLGEEIFRRLLTLASGEPSQSEHHGYGQQEFVPWQIGVIT
ncbi:UxaA family hydrolase [Salinicola sp. DM10]|uniref:UxaA family hydrolase n=1 Tax=Salinicola sp. DM10 TaxID=2815721 RepID=UPI001A906891|nr:altronate dehydratase family protein [Salinicola sp. DM10]MCE3027207.1 altronate dehydratase family protein [Salinicola sp. DM10]